jgi:hypothetical protein
MSNAFSPARPELQCEKVRAICYHLNKRYFPILIQLKSQEL